MPENEQIVTWVAEASIEVVPGSPEEKARCEAIYQASLKEKKQ